MYKHILSVFTKWDQTTQCDRELDDLTGLSLSWRRLVKRKSSQSPVPDM